MKSTSHTLDIQERFAHALHTTARDWRRAIDARLKHLGVSQAAWLAIAAAARADPPLSQSELADRLAVEGATIVAMVDRLERAGFVIRETSPVDRRVNLVRLTPAGYSLFEVVKQEAATVRAVLLGGIAASELESATALLERLQQGIASDDATPLL